MGTRKHWEKQDDLWIAHSELAAAPGYPFYQWLNELMEAKRFDEYLEGRCAKFYAGRYGRPVPIYGLCVSEWLRSAQRPSAAASKKSPPI
jgi:hypothetical protein